MMTASSRRQLGKGLGARERQAKDSEAEQCGSEGELGCADEAELESGAEHHDPMWPVFTAL